MNWKRSLGNNAPLLLAIISSIGVIGTTLLAIHEAPKANKRLEEAVAEKGSELTKFETVKVAGPVYVPAIIMGTSTVA